MNVLLGGVSYGDSPLEWAGVYATLATMIDRLESPDVCASDIIQWACPIPCFGDLSRSVVCTVGLNPSSREFLDEWGEELKGSRRRFHTLNSLGLVSWSGADARHGALILEACSSYFRGRPYDRWFRKLEFVISGASVSYYETPSSACHVDVIPYATMRKWAKLSSEERGSLVSLAGDMLGLLLRDSAVRVLILNGSTVVGQFQTLSSACLERREMEEWALPRQAGHDVPGIAYKGSVEAVSDVMLDREVLVLGFNHNLQSSFGVTRRVSGAIREWIAESCRDVI